MQKISLKKAGSIRNYVNILGVRLDSTSTSSVLNTIGGFLLSKHKFSVFTLNPEILVMAERDRDLKKVLNLSDINIPDGVGLKIAEPSLIIIKGRELFLELLALARKKNWKVFFVGGKGIKNVTAGPMLDENAEPISDRDREIEIETIRKVNKFNPDILFVGFGAPKQEKWIHKWLPELEVGGAMAVGGTFDYVFGKAKPPPKWIEKIGLEWLWRVLHEPKRWFRIFNAVIVFPLKVLCSRLWQKRA